MPGRTAPTVRPMNIRDQPDVWVGRHNPISGVLTNLDSMTPDSNQRTSPRRPEESQGRRSNRRLARQVRAMGVSRRRCDAASITS